MLKSKRMSHCRYLVPTLILVISGLLSIGSLAENKLCFNVSNQRICYFRPQEDIRVKQWENASDICRENNATLPIIENQEVQKVFEQYLRNISLNTKKVWLGGRQVSKREWQWSNKKPFYQPDLIVFGDQDWGTQATIDRTSSAGDLPSNTTIRYLAAPWPCHYICQYTDSQCPAEDSIQNEHHGCLKVFSNQSMIPSEAVTECNTSGGYLAIFDRDEFLTKAPKVYQQMQQEYYSCYYIGLQKIDTAEWFWIRSNDENSTMEGNYNNWSNRNNNSNGDCLFATANDHRWEAGGCHHTKHFICQTIEIQATEKTNTSGNLALIVGLSIGMPLLSVIILIIIIFAIRRRKVRTTSVTRTTAETEEQYQDLSRITAYENETDTYTGLTQADNYLELT